jgi:TolB protein
MAQSCQPLKWWAAGVVLASCTPPNSGISLLWLVPTSGPRATQLTITPLQGSGDYGDLDAWSLPSGDYVQDAGACGYIYLAKLGRTGRTTAVKVPGAVGSVFVQGAYGDQLALTTQFSCQPGSVSLFWFNPATRAVTPLLGPRANGGSVGTVILFEKPEP